MTYPIPAIPNAESPPLAEQVRLRLAKLSYLAFAMCAARILSELGYVDMPLPSRRSFKGPNATGGIDLTAKRQSELGPVPVCIQLKRYKDPRRVSRLNVDVLRGVLLREGVSEGILIATVPYSKPARRVAEGYPGRPIRLIDGAELGQLACASRLGIVEIEDPATNEKHLVLDEGWFRRLETYSAALKQKGGHEKATV